MALSAFEVLTGRTRVPLSGSPPQQPVSLFTANNLHKLSQYTDLYSNADAILHLPIDSDGAGVSVLTPEIRRAVSYFGIQPSPYDSQGPMMAEDMARKYGSVLQRILGSLENAQHPNTFVSLDLPLQLAMLKANCLPKSRAHQDSFHVLLPEGGSILANYLYDESGGGMDPLACPTKETVVSTPPTFATAKRSSTSAAAFTALRGNGMDPVSSAAIAAAVATILGDGDPGHSWATVEKTVQLSRHIREFGAQETPGALRTKYIEYGYV